jgi:hypothetical protein
MLTSITPLGERGRGSRWGVTFAFMLLGATGGGALLGGLLAAVGALTLGAAGGGDWGRIAVIGGLLVAGVALELGFLGLRLPTVRRQVDERWLGAYRGWVYGIGFGFQLGAGMVTIVATAAVYVAFAACLLSGEVLAGIAIGGAFGGLRAATVVAGAGVSDPPALQALGARLARWEPRVRLVTVGCELVLAALAMAAVIGAG